MTFLRPILSNALNISLGINDPAWAQAQLPVKLGGLGIRSACQLAPSAFLASAADASDTLKSMLPASLHNAGASDTLKSMLPASLHNAGASDTLKSMLPASLHNASFPDVTQSALSIWSQGHTTLLVLQAYFSKKSLGYIKMQLMVF